MNEFLNSYLPPWLTGNIHIPFVLFVYLVVEWLRYQFDGIDRRIKPKHLTLIVGLIVALSIYYGEMYFEQVEVPVKILIVSYFVTTISYEYLIKPIKEKFFPWLSDKQKQ